MVISSPYTWLTDYTEKQKWLGGFNQNGESVTTLSKIQDILTQNFEMVSSPQDASFVIRETQRKFQHTIAQVTIWRRV